jgi:hypothetical protein
MLAVMIIKIFINDLYCLLLLNSKISELRYDGTIFLFATASRPGLGPILPHIQWIPKGKAAGA